MKGTTPEALCLKGTTPEALCSLMVPVLGVIGLDGVFKRSLPVPGWSSYVLGRHPAERGCFEVEVITGSEGRVEAALLSHHHAFYQAETLGDTERRAFHEGLIASELRGQREFSWGHVLCRLNSSTKRDWLVLVYHPFTNIPLHQKETYQRLWEHEIAPEA